MCWTLGIHVDAIQNIPRKDSRLQNLAHCNQPWKQISFTCHKLLIRKYSTTRKCKARNVILYYVLSHVNIQITVVLGTTVFSLYILFQFIRMCLCACIQIDYGHFLFCGMPLMECCRIDDTLPENTIIGLSPSCVANCTLAPIPLSQVVRGYLEVSSSLLVVAAMHWHFGDDLAWNLNVLHGQRSGAFLFKWYLKLQGSW